MYLPVTTGCSMMISCVPDCQSPGKRRQEKERFQIYRCPYAQYTARSAGILPLSDYRWSCGFCWDCLPVDLLRDNCIGCDASSRSFQAFGTAVTVFPILNSLTNLCP
ncbi:hypothetical protein AcV7_002081 [Taiwanofungus camphoratus]|nr:hypothetical protein AcV7_002081 [Antrodia cinnamomea]